MYPYTNQRRPASDQVNHISYRSLGSNAAVALQLRSCENVIELLASAREDSGFPVTIHSCRREVVNLDEVSGRIFDRLIIVNQGFVFTPLRLEMVAVLPRLSDYQVRH
mmetsp:Transcript_29688/g.41381  ORF Transcript_29688/g.41381 Transcript_29688/m.41381 type:complete len:108 (-) Transcript_29688:849-1172(-)